MKALGITNSDEIPQPSNYVQGVVFAAGTGQAFDVPAGAGYVAFSFPSDFWVKFGSTGVVIPTSSTTAGSTSPELNPTARNIGSSAGCTGISLISATTQAGSISWYAP